MNNPKPAQCIIKWIEAFILDRKVQNVAPGTLYFYKFKLQLLATYCQEHGVAEVERITPDLLRQYLIWLQETDHNPGGINACYRAAKTFLRWYWSENDLVDKPPTAKVKAPKIPEEILEPVSLDDINTLLATCDRILLGLRDRAILLVLLDTGVRAAELLSMTRDDADLVTGAVIVREGKGRKPRIVFCGQDTRRALRAYVRNRSDANPALWITDDTEPLTYWGLRSMITRRAAAAGIDPPQLHAFRRAFALNMLRAGVDVYTLQILMGHKDLQVLRRYLKQNSDDLQIAHARGSPVQKLRR